MADQDRIQELETKVAQLTERLEQLTGAAPTGEPAVPTAVEHVQAEPIVADEIVEPSGSRRNLFKLAGATAAGATAMAIANSTPVAAADTDPIEVGATTTQGNTGRTTTILSYTNADGPQATGILGPVSANVFLARDNPSGPVIIGSTSSSAYPAASAGYAYRAVANGLYGYSANGGYGVVGFGATDEVGVLARGGGANLEFHNDGDAPASRSDAHVVGQVIADSNGALWYCVASGTPGTWRKIADAATAGAYHAVTPFRAYDSRVPAPAQGKINEGGTRTISVKDARDVTTGAVTTADVVPAGATAVTYNVTIARTAAIGYLYVAPGGTASIAASTINWTGAGQIAANAATVGLDGSRQIKVFCDGAGASTDFIIDVTGYYV